MRWAKTVGMVIAAVVTAYLTVRVAEHLSSEEATVTMMLDEERGVVCYVYERHGISCIYDPKQIEQKTGEWQ